MVKFFLIGNPTERESNDDQEIRTIESIEQRSRAKSKYNRSTAHAAPTSNIVERLFSLSKDIMKPNTRQMDPSTLDARVMLRLNKDLWDVYTVQDCISEAAMMMMISGL